MKIVQQMLDHKSATLTLDLYGHLYADRLDVVVDAMDAARAAAMQRRHQAGTTAGQAQVIGFPK